MFERSTMAVTALACLAIGGCASTRYPIAPTWSQTEGQAMSCDQLRSEAENSRQLQRRIEGIASGDPSALKERPRLYSMARPDADRAAEARLAGIEAEMQAKACPA